MSLVGRLKSSSLQALKRKRKPCRVADGGMLYFVVTKTGSTHWMFRYTSPITGKRREPTLGPYPEIGLSEARQLALEWRSLLARGLDPKNERDRKCEARRNTVDSVWQGFYERRKRRVESHEKDLSLYDREIRGKIGHLPADEVMPLDLMPILDSIARGDDPRPTVANDALGLLKKLFEYAVNFHFAKINPALQLGPNEAGGRELPRSRALMGSEFSLLFSGLRAAGLAFSRQNYLAVALLLVLGVRKMELLSAKWNSFDLDAGEWSLEANDTKTKHSIVIPLEPEVVMIFRELKVLSAGSEYVFPARRRAKKPRAGHVSPDTLNAAMKKVELNIEHHTVHDLRRSCRTALAMLEVSEVVAERYINHKVTTYNWHDYRDERRAAQRRLIDYLWPLTGLDQDPTFRELDPQPALKSLA